LERLAACLASGADPNEFRAVTDRTALHEAACYGQAACVAALLAAGARPLAKGPYRWTALHYAARQGHVTVIRQLLAADPSTASVKTSFGASPLSVALANMHLDAARCLLAEGPPMPASQLLRSLQHGGPRVLLLYADVVARQPLTAGEWALVPIACPGLGAALPAVLQRSVEEAALLVWRLRTEYRQRLRTAALCLARAPKQLLVGPLPAPLIWHTLALSVA